MAFLKFMVVTVGIGILVGFAMLLNLVVSKQDGRSVSEPDHSTAQILDQNRVPPARIELRHGPVISVTPHHNGSILLAGDQAGKQELLILNQEGRVKQRIQLTVTP